MMRKLLALVPFLRGKTRVAKRLYRTITGPKEPFIGEIGNGYLVEYWPWLWNDFGTYLVGSLEPFFHSYFKSLIRNGSIIFDIGAYIGNYGFSAGGQSFNGEVHFFEPDPRSFKRISEAIERNRLRNFHILNSAVGEKQGHVSFQFAEDMVQSRLLGLGKEKGDIGQNIPVPVLTVDEYFKDTHTRSLDLMKIDVEGAEMFVLRGAFKTIQEFRPVIFLEVHRNLCRTFGISSREIIEFFLALDYELFNIKSGLKRPKLAPLLRNDLDEQPRKLMVAIPPGAGT